MSVKVMGLVWDHFPEGGGDMLTALALADRADHDGTSIYPAVSTLAQATRQSERTVQRQLAAMVKAGFLTLVREANAGQRRPREYKINLDWLAAQGCQIVRGDKLAPVTKDAMRGDTALSPDPSLDPPSNNKISARTCATPKTEPHHCPTTWLPDDLTVQRLVDESNIHPDFVAERTPEFVGFWSSQTRKDRRRRDWNPTFAQHIRDKWAELGYDWCKNRGVLTPAQRAAEKLQTSKPQVAAAAGERPLWQVIGFRSEEDFDRFNHDFQARWWLSARYADQLPDALRDKAKAQGSAYRLAKLMPAPDAAALLLPEQGYGADEISGIVKVLKQRAADRAARQAHGQGRGVPAVPGAVVSGAYNRVPAR